MAEVQMVNRTRQHCACWPLMLSMRPLQLERARTLLRYVRSERILLSPRLAKLEPGCNIMCTCRVLGAQVTPPADKQHASKIFAAP